MLSQTVIPKNLHNCVYKNIVKIHVYSTVVNFSLILRRVSVNKLEKKKLIRFKGNYEYYKLSFIVGLLRVFIMLV